MEQKSGADLAQKITSANTSLRQVPALVKKVPLLLNNPDYWSSVGRVLDYGGGKYDLCTNYLRDRGATNLVYDPFNRSPEHNKQVLDSLNRHKANAAICANVLNVIRRPVVRLQVLKHIRELVTEDALVFFDCYEGRGDSRGRKTSKGWQANRPLRSYLHEIKKVFPYVIYKRRVIVASSIKHNI